MGLLLRFYRALSAAIFPLLKPRLARRHSVGFGERCGVYSEEKLAALRGRRPLWVHAVSVGEVQAAAPVVRLAAADGWEGRIILSTVTETGARQAANLLGDAAVHIYAPWDAPGVVRRACDAFTPSLYMTVETEVWPNLLSELRGRGVPTCIMGARISDRTWARAKRFRAPLREAYGLFDLVLARGEEDAKRLAAIGVDMRRVRVVGDTKIDAISARREAARQNLPVLRQRLGLHPDTPCFVAGSTHAGEDEILLRAYAALKESPEAADLRLILVPRHPERAHDVMECARHTGRAALSSELGLGYPGTRPEIVVVDEIGVLFGLYGVASVAFIGGSIVPRGGQNILEPLSWGVPVLHGPHMEDFYEPARYFDERGASCVVHTAEEVAECVRTWLYDGANSVRSVCGEAAAYFDARSGAAARAWKRITEIERR